MPRAEIGHYVKIYDQMNSFEYEGIFLDEDTGSLLGSITVLVAKIIKESNPGRVEIGNSITLPTPRYVPIFIRELTEQERLLYVQS